MEATLENIFWNAYIPAKQKRGRRTNTLDGYISSVKKHVLPAFGNRSLPEITRPAIQDWVDGFELPGAAKKAYNCLRQVIRWAIMDGLLLLADPTVGIELPRKPAYKPETLTQRRLKRWIRGMVGCECEAAAIVEAALGTRPGECYYIRWEKINWRTGHVPIEGTLQQASKGVEEYPTKTAKGERDGWLPAWALDRLHQIWLELGKPKGRIIGDLTPSQASYRIRVWAEKHKLPRITMKNLRHTWGTLAAQSGAKIEDVAAMMGHSSIQTTYRYYYAMTAARAKRIQKKVAQTVVGKSYRDMYEGIDLKFSVLPEMLPKAA